MKPDVNNKAVYARRDIKKTSERAQVSSLSSVACPAYMKNLDLILGTYKWKDLGY